MPNAVKSFSNKIDVYDLFHQYSFDEIEYTAHLNSGQIIEGVLDEHGRTDTILSNDQEEIDVFIGFKDADWGLELIETDFDGDLESVVCDADEDEECEWLGSDDDTFGLQLDKYPNLTKRIQSKNAG